MNQSIHLIIGGIVILFFLLSFLYHRHLYQFLFALLTAYTLLIYLDFAADRAVQQKLGIGALVLLVLTLIAMFTARHLESKRIKAYEQRERQQ